MHAEQTRKILLVTKKDLLIDVLSVYLEGLFPSEIDVADTSRKVEQCFEGDNAKVVDLLIIEDERLLTAARKTIASFMAPTIILGKNGEQTAHVGRKLTYLRPPVTLDSLAKALEEVTQEGKIPKREYCPVRLEVLVLFGRALNQDLYRKTKDGKYEVTFPKGKRLDLSDSTFTELSENKYLFLKTNDFLPFMKSFAAEIQNAASVSGDEVFSFGENVKTAETVHELLANAIPELGFTPELQKATKVSIDLAVTAIKKDPRLTDMIAELTKLDSSYRTWHSVALCYMACRLSNLMTWDSPNTHYKLSLASFLHDIKVTNPKLERARTLEDIRRINPNYAERNEYLEHPHAAAALARHMRDFPGDVDQIIAQHHELPNGTGFPMALNHTKISPLSCVFIVAHDLVEDLFDHSESFSLKDSVERLEGVYTQGYFKKVVNALKELASKEAVG